MNQAVREGGMHKARFGEVEQRGVALTPEGRQLYDKAFIADNGGEIEPGSNLPDSLEQLRKQNLAYFKYHATDKGVSTASDMLQDKSLDELVETGYVGYIPITYEDFLPVSAAGIFQSNLSEGSGLLRDNVDGGVYTLSTMEKIIGKKILDSFTLYAAQQQNSISATCSDLGVEDL